MSSFEKHLSYLNKNIENQENYSSKLSEILPQNASVNFDILNEL